MAFIGKKPTDAPLTSSDVADGIITNAKLAQDIISADTALGAEPADTDEFLVSDAGTLKRMDYSHIKASSAWTLIKTETASSSSAITFAHGTSDVTFDSTYKIYCIIGQSIVSASNNVELNLYTSNDGGSSYETSYDATDTRGFSSSSSINITNSTSVIGHSGSFGNASGRNGSIIVWCPSPSESGTFHTVYGDSIVNDDQGYVRRGMFAGMHETAEAYDAIKFEMSSGNIASGTFSLYGVAT